MMRGRIADRLMRLEQSQPTGEENIEMMARIERARARVEASLTPEERAWRQSPEYLAGQAARRARFDQVVASSGRRGRRPTIAEMLRA